MVRLNPIKYIFEHISLVFIYSFLFQFYPILMKQMFRTRSGLVQSGIILLIIIILHTYTYILSHAGCNDYQIHIHGPINKKKQLNKSTKKTDDKKKKKCLN